MKIAKLKSILLILIIMCVLTSCFQRKYIDIAGQEPYTSMLGYKFKSRVDLLALGVTFDQNYKGDADYVFLMARPGVSGPEIKFEEVLPKGIEFDVVGVLKSDGMSGERLLYVVEFQREQSLERYPFVIEILGDINSPNKGLNAEELVFIGR